MRLDATFIFLLGLGITVMGCAPNVSNGTRDHAKPVQLGLELQKKGDLEGTIAEYWTALRLNPDDAVAHYNFGTARAAQGDLDKAMEEFRTALGLNPKLVIIHYHLGRFLMDQGNLFKAEKELEEFIRLAQDQPSLHDEMDDAKRRLDKLSVFQE